MFLFLKAVQWSQWMCNRLQCFTILRYRYTLTKASKTRRKPKNMYNVNFLTLILLLLISHKMPQSLHALQITDMLN